MALPQIDLMPARIRIAALLRKAILSGEYSAGQKLSLTDIAAQTGVSRTPVREAFQMLESEDLLELRMNKGAIVKSITADVIRDHYEMRILLEGEAIFRATNRHADVTEVQKAHSEIRAKNGYFKADEYTAYNNLFHNTIWHGAGSPKLITFLESLWNGSSFGKTVSAKDHQLMSIAEHDRMLRCMVDHNADLAKKEMEMHIKRSMQNILESFDVPR